NHRAGRLWSGGSPRRPGGGMAAAIRQLLSHPARSKAMGERGRRYAVEQLSRSACVEKIERLLAACAKGRPG
ncbi:hypothetical protein MYX77_13000, partial [Acidobacteriia bacterium AH_259_A11_L15]|nr:hypothetical protein [Acidobacteriia bacterium AH_259_A11_L15]